MFIARLMRDEDEDAVNALRVAGYASASWFQMKDAPALHVRNDYPHTRVMVVSPAQRPAQVVATMAATMNYERGLLEDTLGANLQGLPIVLPGMSLVRLSVHQDYRGLALNHLLRKISLEAAMELARDARVLAMFGSQSAGTPNVPAMRAMGYAYHNVPPQRLNHVRLEDGALLAYVLPAARFAAVHQSMQALLSDKGIDAEWRGPSLASALEAVPLAA